MREEKEWIVETEELSYTYEGNDSKALDKVSLKLGRGQKIAFMGGNGSGKSTFFLCLNGILKPREGRVLIDGCPVNIRARGFWM